MAGNITAGMDIAQVRTMAAQMNTAGTQITELMNKLTQVLNVTPWAGSDRERFVSEWNGQHKANLQKVATVLADISRVATQQANDQEATSR